MARRLPSPVRPERPPGRWGDRRAAHRWVAVHRRAISAALAFVAVLLGLSALAPETATPASTTTVAGPGLGDDERAVPLRIDDRGVASLLAPGDVVDVIGTDHRGSTSLIASAVRVTSLPADDSTWTGNEGGLVVVAADPATALAIAGASTRGSITVTIHP